MSHVSAVREAALNSERIDTHAHLSDFYPDLAAQASQLAQFTTAQQVSDARVIAEGCRVLYGSDPGAFLRSDAPPEVFRKAAALRAQGSWDAVRHALDHARIRRQLAFSDHQKNSGPFAGQLSTGRLAYLAYIDGAINGDGRYPSPDYDEPFRYYERLCRQFGPLTTLADYLNALDAAIDGWRAWGVVGMKAAIAYTSGLAVSDPSRQAAGAAFARKNDMTEADFRTVHDFAFRHALSACRRNHLPAVIHTGYIVWGHGNLLQTNPLHLHNLLIDPRYRGVTFVLLHGGFPYVGETSYLGGMFSNVIVDFTWISWAAPTRFRQALAEWLEVIPHDRFCWGSDSCTPESIAGIDHIVRRQIAEVLDDCVARKVVDERYALEFIENCYLKTPQRVFGLPA
jgi:hypothetical protein